MLLDDLEAVLQSRRDDPPEGSYTAMLLADPVRLARAMLLKGVGGISWHSPLQTSELVDFIEIVNRELERSVDSLQILLDRRGVGNIREEAVKTVAADQVVADPGKSLEKEPAKAVAKPVKKPEASVFELDLDAVPIEDATSLSDLFETDSEPEPEPGSEPAPPPVQEKTECDFALSQLRICCHDILDEYDNKAISKQEAVDSLAYEFNERFEERVEEVRRETAIKIQRLENIKDMVMEELEQHGLAAVVATRELEVLSMNRTAREILGNIDRLPEGSPLAAFVRSGRQKQIIRIRGVSRRAHMIISSQQGDDGAILVCLESCENE